MQFTDTKTGSFSGSCSTFLSERVNSHTTSRASFVAVAKPAWSSTLTSVHLCMMRPSTSSSFLLWRRRCASFSHSFFFFLWIEWMTDQTELTRSLILFQVVVLTTRLLTVKPQSSATQVSFGRDFMPSSCIEKRRSSLIGWESSLEDVQVSSTHANT